MAEINLLKNELRKKGPFGGESFSPKLRQIMYAIIGILVAEVLLYGAFYFWDKRTARQIQETESSAAAADFEIQKIDKELSEAISFQKRLKNFEILLKNHLYWSLAFVNLEKYTYKGAVYQSLQVDELGHKFLISGAVPTYTDLGKLMLGLMKSPEIQDVSLISSAREEGRSSGYRFNLLVTFNPKLFLK